MKVLRWCFQKPVERKSYLPIAVHVVLLFKCKYNFCNIIFKLQIQISKKIIFAVGIDCQWFLSNLTAKWQDSQM